MTALARPARLLARVSMIAGVLATPVASVSAAPVSPAMPNPMPPVTAPANPLPPPGIIVPTVGLTEPPPPPTCPPLGPGGGLVNVADGTAITPAEIQQFKATWMQPADCQSWVAGAQHELSMRQPGWATAERMAAMVRMYELTRDAVYLNHLRELIQVALFYRDDRYPGNTDPTCKRCERTPIDDFRGGHMAAWGHAADYYAGLSGVDEGISSIFAYPIAAFARIVAEDPSLQATYGADAVRYADAAMATMWALMPQVKFQRAGSFFEGYLAHPEAYATKLTNCNGNNTCQNLHDFAGRPMAHNESGAFMMVLIELWRALDSPFYRRAAPQTNYVELTRGLIPFVVSRNQRFFVNHLQTLTDNANRVPRFAWHHEDGIPHSVNVEDTAHGSLDMRYLDVLRRNFDRLNAVVAPAGEPIALDTSILSRFANTFLTKIADGAWTAGGSTFASNVNGERRDPKYNAACDGWVSLAVADSGVYDICHEVSLRVVGGWQPNLRMGNHSALLMNKQFYRYREVNPNQGDPHCGPHPC